MKTLREDIQECVPEEGKDILLKVCQKVLSDRGTTSIDSPKITVLITLLLEDIQKHRKLEDKHICQLVLIARRKLPRLTLIEKLLISQGIPFQEITYDSEKFSRIRKTAQTFEDAIAPRRLSSLIKNQHLFEDRVTAFVQNRSLTNDAMRQCVRVVLNTVRGMISADIEHFLNTIPLKRLRTYSAMSLQPVAKNFLIWSPIIACLKHHEQQTNEIAQKIKKLFEKLKNYLKNFWSAVDESLIEDAIQEVILHELESDEGYCYEANLVSWLFSAANNWLRRHYVAYQSESIENLDGENIQDLLDPKDEYEYCKLFRQWQERYLLVLTFFRSEEQVKEVWKEMLHNSEISDADLAAKLGIHRNNVATMRRRLRQRLGVLRFILDEVPEHGMEDTPGDLSVLGWIKMKWGVALKDVPTLRHLAGLARAAKLERTLAWAILSRLLVDENKTEAESLEKILYLLKEVGSMNPRTITNTINLVSPWWQHKTLSQLKNLLKQKKVGFFLSPCWYLYVLQNGYVEEDIIHILKPSRHEEQWIRMIIRKLSCKV